MGTWYAERARRLPGYPPRQTLRLLPVRDAMRRSARTGCTVTIDDEYAPQRGRRAPQVVH